MISNARSHKQATQKTPSTRNAVETAIDLSKADRKSTWDAVTATEKKQRFGYGEPVEPLPSPPKERNE